MSTIINPADVQGVLNLMDSILGAKLQQLIIPVSSDKALIVALAQPGNPASPVILTPMTLACLTPPAVDEAPKALGDSQPTNIAPLGQPQGHGSDAPIPQNGNLEDPQGVSGSEQPVGTTQPPSEASDSGEASATQN